ncbi:MAG TPA: APC family permease [Chloroflexota bacterium]|nr:APC family permease [Chloroflexota bacterium]
MTHDATSAPEVSPYVSAERELEALGYKQELNRGLSVIGTIALSLSDITPTASLLVIGPVVIATAGTASVWSYLLGGFIALNVALCMGELGSMFPVAGGLYSIVTRVLGRPIGFLALLDYVGQAVFLPASIALGIGTYISSLFPTISTNVAATVIMVAVTLIALIRINQNAIITGIFLLLELAVVSSMAVAGFTHWRQPFSILSHPVMTNGRGGLTGVGVSLVIAAIATALFSVNGYDSAINFSEETEGEASHVGQAVVIAASTGIFFELVPFIAIVFGAGSLAAFLASATPLTDAVGGAFGSGFKNVVTVGAIIAIFNASLAITLQFARVMFASGRDRAWPGPISDAFAQVWGATRAPWVATLFVGVLASALCLQGKLATVVTFTAVLIIVLYALIAISALVSHRTQRQLPRPWRMPLFPIPPIIALAGVGIALSQQKVSDLLIVLGIFVAGAIYYGLFIYPRQDRYWYMTTNPEAELAALDNESV